MAAYILARLLSCRGISTIGRSGLAALVALAFVLLALPAVASAASGSISGEVTRAAGGSAVEDAEVCAESALEFKCARTAADGKYEIEGLPPGVYIVSFEAGAGDPALLRQYYEGVSRWEQATEIVLGSGEAKTGIDATLEEPGEIAGRVVAAQGGAPIASIVVCAWSEDAEDEFEGCRVTASDGSYEFVDLVPGSYKLVFFPEESGYELLVLNSVSVSSGATHSGVDAALWPAGRVSGHVYAAFDHRPLGGISVCAIWDPTGELGGCTITSKAGAYGFVFEEGGPWKIAFSADPSEFETFERGEITADAWPTQFWNMNPTLGEADVINIGQGRAFTDVDGLLGPGPPPQPAPPSGSSNPPATTTPAPVAINPPPLPPKPIHCGKGKVKKRVKGKTRCVNRHKPRHHHKQHHRNS